MKDDEESIYSKFSNQDPASGGYGDQEETVLAKPIKNISAKAKKKKKNKAAKKARRKNRK